MIKKAVCVASIFLLPLHVYAFDIAHEYDQEFTIQGLYIEPDKERNTEYGAGFRLTYAFRMTERWWFEPQFFGSVLDTDTDDMLDSYQQGLGVDFSYRFTNKTAFDPYILFGVGGVRNDAAGVPEEDVGVDVFANVGVGVLSAPFTDSGLRFKFEARYLHDTFLDGYEDIHVGLGLTIPIGFVRERIVEVEKIIVKETQYSLADSDKDGVVDGVDQCPNTLKGLEVNSVGCVAVDKEQSVVLNGVSFEFNSARLGANARDILRPAADALKGQPNLKIEIAGHSDNVGNADYNKKLSKQRAQSVRAFFIEQGVSAQQMQANGYGDEKPLMSNDTEEGRERNRRVEFNVISQNQNNDGGES